MNEQEKNDFVLGCAVGFHMSSNEIDCFIQKYGLDLDRDPLMHCQNALRDHVGENVYERGNRKIAARKRMTNIYFN